MTWDLITKALSALLIIPLWLTFIPGILIIMILKADFKRSKRIFRELNLHTVVSRKKIIICIRSTFLHVVLPGQEEGADDLDLGEGAKYPSMQDLGEDLDSVLDQLDIQFVVGLGEGAGANILARL